MRWLSLRPVYFLGLASYSLFLVHDPIVRGSIDCIIERRSGVIEVLEFKTGRPAPEHEHQLAVYVNAARALFPGRLVSGKLIYAQSREQLSGAGGV